MNPLKLPTLTALIFVAACQETGDDIKTPVSEESLYQHVGEEIPLETALEWVNYHREQVLTAARDYRPAYNVTANGLEAMLNSVPSFVGVAFHYAIDDSDVLHILAIPIGDDMLLWSPTPDRIIIDTNTGEPLDDQLARDWTESFKLQKPEGVHYHFFGKTVFEQMQALPYFNSVDIAPGTHTTELTPELLMIVWNESFSSASRVHNVAATAYDASNPCPPCIIIEDPDKP